MMRHGLHKSRVSPSALISQNRFSLSAKRLSLRFQPSSTASFAVLPVNERHGLLFSEGPTPPMFTPNKGDPGGSEKISDREWQIRTGRGIYILQKTLPDFFDTGLVSSVDSGDIDTGESHTPQVESIYSPTIRLTYTPPVALPSPFPRTLGLEGLPLYLASSVFIRHTMKALYSDLRVKLRKMTVQGSSSSSSSLGMNTAGTRSNQQREKSLFISVDVYGTTRVSGGVGQWQIDSTYTFSSVSGLIQAHNISSIHPAPHQAAYDALRASFSNVFGFGGPGSDIRPGEVRVVDNKDVGER